LRIGEKDFEMEKAVSWSSRSYRWRTYSYNTNY